MVPSVVRFECCKGRPWESFSADEARWWLLTGIAFEYVLRERRVSKLRHMQVMI
jgi:hypothetical protein